MRHLIVLSILTLATLAKAQTTGQNVIQKKSASAGFTYESFTLGNSSLVGRSGAGVMSGISLGSGLQMTGTTLSLSGGGFLTSSNNLSDVASPSVARSNLGLGTLATQNGTIGDYITSASVAASYQPLNAKLTSFAALADAAGVLTNNGSGTHSWTATTTGGNGATDSGKIPIMSSNGGLTLGGVNVQDGQVLTINTDIADCIKVNVHTFGAGVYSELDGSGSQAFHAHITAESSGGHVGYDGDMTGGSGVNYFARGILQPSGYLLYGQEIVATQQQDRYTIDAQGDHTWYANGTTVTTGSNKTSLAVATPSGTNTITIPARTGTIITSGDTGTVTNTMLAGSIAVSKLAITGTADGTKFLRDDGSWQAISTGLTIGTTTITGGTTGRLLTSGTTVGELTLGTGVSSALGNTVNAANGLLTYGIIGTSGAAVPLLNVTNTWSTQRFGTSTVYADTSSSAIGLWDNAFGYRMRMRGADPVVAGSASLEFGALGFITWQSTNRSDAGTTDTYLGRNAAAQIQLGLDAATPVAQRLKAGDGSGTNIDGSSLTLSGGLSTGTGDDGDVILQTTMTGNTGTSANSYQTRQHTPAKFTNLTEGTATNVVSISLPSGRVTGGTATVTVWASDGTDHQALTSEVRFSAVNKAGTITATTSQTDGTTAASAGTLTVTYDATASGNNILLRANATSSLTQTTLRARLIITALNGDDVQTVTPQ